MLGKSHGQRSLVGYSPRGCKESDMTERLHFHFSCPSSRWCHPAISSSVVSFSSHLQSSQHQGLFKWVSSSHQVAKVLEFQLQHQSFQWIFRTDFLYSWIALQSKGLSSLLQHHSSKASILQCSAFFIVQLSHPSMTTGKTIALTRWTFVGKVMSLLFNMLSRLVITFLSFNFMAPVTICSDFGALQNKVCHCFRCICLPRSDGTICHDLSFLNVELVWVYWLIIRGSGIIRRESCKGQGMGKGTWNFHPFSELVTVLTFPSPHISSPKLFKPCPLKKEKNFLMDASLYRHYY